MRSAVEFPDNQNGASIGPTLSFVVDIEQAFEPQLKEAVAACLQGRSSWLQDSLPEGVTVCGFRGFGDFSEGLAAIKIDVFR